MLLGRAVERIRHIAVDTTSLRISREFRLLWIGQAISFIGTQVTIIAAPYQVFLISHSSFAVALLSLFQLVPLLLFSLYGGALADVVDRRRMLLITQVLLAMTSAMLAVATFAGWTPLWFIFAITAVAASVAALDQPTRRAAIPRLVPREQIASANALGSILNQTARIVGPGIAGVVLARFGIGTAYAIDAVTFGAAIYTIAIMAPIPSELGTSSGGRLAAIWEGLTYLRTQPVLLSTFVIDLNAMIFGFPKALFPALALQVFKVGAGGLGLLYAAPSVGSLTGALLSGWVGKVRHMGRATIVMVLIWGGAITAFGLLRDHFWLALPFLVIGGMSDVSSAVLRSTILQLSLPDRLRGRISAVQYMVVQGGPRLGDIEAGTVATLTNVQFSVISGGVLSAVGAVILALAVPAFWHYDSKRTELEPVGEA
ncbi:MAG TPA: MFS transporter [Bryobacteraceae bacterium]|nr:MFS transporter [Bryobacteraceae bacterium]